VGRAVIGFAEALEAVPGCVVELEADRRGQGDALIPVAMSVTWRALAGQNKRFSPFSAATR
jgi:hypothetical protein